MEQFANLFFGFVDSRHHDMGRFFACHLDDELAQVAFYRFNAFCFKIMVQLDFLADHRFAFDHQLAVFGCDDVVDNLAGFGRGFCPVHFHAQLSQVFFQLLQQGWQFRQ